jgi:hypothetical protein
MTAYEENRRLVRSQRPGRNRQGFARRELLQEVTEKWPELGDERKWAESALLSPHNQDQLLAELKQLPSWKSYHDRRQQMETANTESDQREIRVAKFRKLIHALEVIALEKNLSLVATSQMVERYQQIVSLEESSLITSDGRE